MDLDSLNLDTFDGAMGDVLFAFGKADIATGAVRNIDKLAESLEKHPERNVLIEGHTDSVGSDEFNLTLSQKRADAVKEVLTGKVVNQEQILTKRYGKQFPVAGFNDTCWEYADRDLMALMGSDRLRRILAYMLDENEFLSPYGIRALSLWRLPLTAK